MKATVFEELGKLVLKNVEIPRIIFDDQVLIEVEACSICGTDVHITAIPPGYIARKGVILGHEFCGHVVKLGTTVKSLHIGDRVVVNPNNYCGVCSYCRRNMPNQCENLEALGIEYDGAFAKYCVVREKVAYKISEGVPAEVAACVEPLACAVNGLNKVSVKPGDNAVVIGAGPIGLIIAMLLEASGVTRIFLLETSVYRASFAREIKPTWRVINPLEEDVTDIIARETGTGADIVFDVTGNQAVSAIDLARKGGSVVLFGVDHRAHAEMIQSQITVKELSVRGTWLANATFPEAIRVVEQEAIDLKALISEVISLDQVGAGIEKLRRGDAIKIVVKP